MMEPLFKHWRTSYERIEKFISDTYFTDVNLYGRLFTETSPLTDISHHGDSEKTLKIENVMAISTWQNITTDQKFGPTWSLHWFRITLPRGLTNSSSNLFLRWNAGCECLIFDGNGRLLEATNDVSKKELVPLDDAALESGLLFVQAACHDLFGAGAGGMIQPTDPHHSFGIKTAAVVRVNPRVRTLLNCLKLLMDIAQKLEGERAHDALFAANKIINLCCNDHSDQVYDKSLAIARDFLAQPGRATRHTVYAIANCHIDTAWLWGYEETRLKTARSWSNTLRLLERHRSLKFACSQAQQLAWLQQDFPKLFSELKAKAGTDQFLPVGGVWVEMDANIPSGESFIRQFLYGQKFFLKEFGRYCKEFWLPDTFGYSAQLPQIVTLCQIERFLTQKISWNLFNKFPHHTFFWHGIDNSRVLTHFSPGDSYSMEGNVEELQRSLENFADKARSKSSLFLFGHGDGGQGPTEEMVERLEMLEDCDGLPKVRLSSPDAFFSEVEAEDKHRLCSWHGELYLELHNGTYTSQRQTKLRNAAMEWLLKFLDFAFVFDFLSSGRPADLSPVHRLWQHVLLHQFHDVIPGSSIEKVYRTVHQMYEEDFETLAALLREIADRQNATDDFNRFNTTQWPVTVERKGELFQVQALSSLHLPDSASRLLSSCENNGVFSIQNNFFAVSIDDFGRISRLECMSHPGINLVPAGGVMGALCLYDDVPLYWDAWDVMDYNWETRCAIEKLPKYKRLKPCRQVLRSEHLIEMVVQHKISDVSEIKQSIIVYSYQPYIHFRTEVTWHEAHKLLRVEFPTILNSGATAEYEIQMGALRRQHCANTSWDTAQHEVCSHRWMDLSEPTFGLSILKEAIYGGLIRSNTLHLSLLRSPKAPDATADMGRHELHYALFPHAGGWRNAGTTRFAHQFCEFVAPRARKQPVFSAQPLPGLKVTQSLISLLPGSSDAEFPMSVVLSSVKLGYDKPDAVIVRLYESFGATTKVLLKINSGTIASADSVDCLEESVSPISLRVNENGVELHFSPFQIRCLKITFEM